MTSALAAGMAFGAAAAATAAATPGAIRLAHRLRFYDRPSGYKQHGHVTPYLGGLAVVLGLLAGVLATGTMHAHYLPLIFATVAVWGLGTLDDHRNLHPGLRVGVEAGLATWLWTAGLGWNLVAAEFVNLVVTVGWVVLVVNAFNLMDNMDGSGSTTGAVAAAGIGGFAVIGGDAALAALSFALAGALLGFLPSNLSRPAKVFLGDGGSMVVGFVVAVTAMTAVPVADLGFGAVLCASLVVGLPLLDTALVIISRLRRSAPLLMGGRDHLTHRLLVRVGSTRAVSAILASAGGALGGAALWSGSASRPAVLWTFVSCVVGGICVIAVLERSHEKSLHLRAVVQAREGA